MGELILPVKEVMVTDVVAVTPETPITVAAKKMAKNKVGSVVVVKNKKVLGIITERDMLARVIAEGINFRKLPVSRIMSSPVITIMEGTDLMEAAELMGDQNIRRLPVVDDEGKIVGLLTAMDIIKVAPEIVEIKSNRNNIRWQSPPETTGIGICKLCGNRADKLFEKDGAWVCEGCLDI
jgi:CBS domain-containing protein